MPLLLPLTDAARIEIDAMLSNLSAPAAHQSQMPRVQPKLTRSLFRPFAVKLRTTVRRARATNRPVPVACASISTGGVPAR